MTYDEKLEFLLFASGCAHKKNICVKVTKEKENTPRGLTEPPFYLPFMRHSRYLNVFHIRRDLLNSIYSNVMFGLNGKSMMRQARHC